MVFKFMVANNTKLGSVFLKAASQYFSFILDFGFLAVEESRLGTRCAVVVYKKGEIEIKVIFDAYACEIMASFFDKWRNKYTLLDLFSFYGKEENAGVWKTQACTSSSIESIVANITNFFKEHPALLLDTKSELHRLKKFKKDNFDKNLSAFKLRPVKEKLDVAWKRKDYKTVLEVCEPAKKYLSGVDKRRYLYAKKYNKN